MVAMVKLAFLVAFGVAIVYARPYDVQLQAYPQYYYPQQQQQIQYYLPNVQQQYINTNQPTVAMKQYAKVNDGLVANVAPNIMSQMTDLEKDVASFHDAMAGMAEAEIVSKENKDGSYVVEEKVDNKENLGKKSDLDWRDLYTKQARKQVAKQRSRFEKEMVKFFTNFMCGKDCWLGKQ